MSEQLKTQLVADIRAIIEAVKHSPAQLDNLSLDRVTVRAASAAAELGFSHSPLAISKYRTSDGARHIDAHISGPDGPAFTFNLRTLRKGKWTDEPFDAWWRDRFAAMLNPWIARLASSEDDKPTLPTHRLLSKTHIAVMKSLHAKRGKAVIDIAMRAGYSEKTCGKKLRELEEWNYASRIGKRGGFVITTNGQTAITDSV